MSNNETDHSSQNSIGNVGDESTQPKPFAGFVTPKQNWSRLPHQLINALPLFDSKAEIVVVLYILRHTWGYKDKRKRITLDEFEHGRKRKDGTRIDQGVGMSKPSIVSGLKAAAEHGFIVVEVDDSDKGRVKKFYSLSGDTVLKTFTPTSQETLHRTEKETSERNSKKEKESPATQDAQPTTASNGNGKQRPMYDAIKDIFDFVGSRNGKFAKFLEGRAVKTDGKAFVDANINPPVTPEELRQWHRWYTGHTPDPKYMVKAPDLVQESILKYRRNQASNGATNGTPPDALKFANHIVEPESTINPETMFRNPYGGK